MDILLPAADERSIERQLQDLDTHLHLTRERDTLGRDFYVVIYYQGGSIPPDVVVDWRETDDTPKQLSSGLVYEIQQMMGSGPVDLKKIMARNAERKARKERDMVGFYEDMIEDFKSGRRSPVHRSQGLRMSRDRIRARGGKA